MRYEGNIYRPPSEAYSYILQVTIGCSHNKCRFCSMYKDKKFCVRDTKEIFEDIDMARRAYDKIGRIFLADGDALCLSNRKLTAILDRISEKIPECQRISVYGSAHDVLRKTMTELIELKRRGVEMIYIGAESGNDRILKDMCKGVTRMQLIDAVKKIEATGIKASVTFISGIGGRAMWEKHAIDTGTMISEMNPSYVGLLTLMTESAAPLTGDISEGKFELLSGEEVVAETMLMLKHINIPESDDGHVCVFRSNHASNYVSLRGNLPNDKGKMMSKLRMAMENTGMLKDERFRML